MSEEKETPEAAEGSPAMNRREAIMKDLDAMATRQNELTTEMNALFDELTKGGFDGHGYSADSKVTIPGRLFAGLSSYYVRTAESMAAIQKSLAVVQESIIPMNHICEGVITGAQEVQFEFMKLHKANCLSGATAAPEELAREQAEATMKVEPLGDALDDPKEVEVEVDVTPVKEAK